MADKKMPIESYGVKCMSIGSLVDKREAIVWRGPMTQNVHMQVMKTLEQLRRGVNEGILDVLVIDMPPGTGDAQISISQRLQLSGVRNDEREEENREDALNKLLKKIS